MLKTKALLWAVCTALHFQAAAALVRWDGEALDGQWSNALNWSGNQLPSSTDQVILDNTFVGNSYTVTLPAGMASVMVRTLTISPTPSSTIEVIIPSSNQAAPSFSASGQPYGLVIDRGGIFRNASGSTTAGAYPVVVQDSIRINDGGRYIHNCSRSHANNVAILSRHPSTRFGIFEFNVPSSSAYLISISQRVYGSLQLSAQAAGGNKSYTTSGAFPLLVRGDLLIGHGTNPTLNITSTVTIQGDYKQQGGNFNLATNANNTTLYVGGHFIQDGGRITEDDNGLPVIELNGTAPQQLTLKGTIDNSVSLRINNPAGVTLQSPASLPYHLHLLDGHLITSLTHLLTLQAGCTITVDSLSHNSFVNGPLRKEGLQPGTRFVFPVGKGHSHRWLALQEATGNYVVEFFRSSPRQKSTTYDGEIHHISSIEHWSIEADGATAPTAQVSLSFNDPNSGGVTDMAALRVAQLQGTTWYSAGNTFTAGTPGSNGHVTSTPLSTFNSTDKYFTLASTSASFNPLLLEERTITTNSRISGTAWLSPVLTTSHTTLYLTNTRPGAIQIIITDLAGRVWQQYPAILHSGRNTVLIPAGQLPAGLYIVTLINDQRRKESLRLIKQ